MSQMELPSIHDLQPNEFGGRIARQGFTYQDHLGVKYLINILTDEDVIEIAFETEDDIVIAKNNIVELIQVKSNTLTSNWSASKIVDEDIVQKSINRGRFKENVKYVIATSTGVSRDLECLCDEATIGKRNSKSINLISEKINKKTTISKNLKQHGLDEWLQHCHWIIEPNTTNLIEAECFKKLEEYIHMKYGKLLLPTQKDELYQQILAFVQNASTSKDISKAKIKRDDFIGWLENKMDSIIVPQKGFEKLTRKMNAANIDETTINSAMEMKWKFTIEERERKYIAQNQIDKIKNEVQIVIQKLLKKLDSGELNCTREQFHDLCIDKVDDVAIKNNVSEVIARGCMYDITNRCSHRFTKPTP